VQFIKKNPTRCNNVSKFLLFHTYMKLNMFRRHTDHHQEPKTALAASGFFIRGRLLNVQLVEVVRHSVPDNFHQLQVQQPSTYKKPEAASGFRLLMMVGVSPKHVELHINTE
jgi:hypothetical protein